ncbi:DUF2577 family protein [Longirhabdus pacifica]|uniref:DUF2577 family protein n=1 Tax=Longirhabdus pacifica TaxID=2305227 RepID=UPI0010092E98|nr:DUF2577 family protein [Longirhabdus pacifica]
MNKLEGNAYSQMVQLMKEVGYNKDIDIELATVLEIDADQNILKIKVDNMDVVLEGDDLIVAEHLLHHTRQMEIVDQSLIVDATSDGVTEHDIAASGNFSGTIGSYTGNGNINITTDSVHFTKLKLLAKISTKVDQPLMHKIHSPLQVNDRIIVASIDNNQHFIVLDRVSKEE